MKIRYVERAFSQASTRVIAQANTIIAAYEAQGFDLTLRQLYYQFVSRGLIPNKDSEYKRLGSIVNDARLAGLIDWDRILDRTRNIQRNAHWEDPAGVIESALSSYHIDYWEGQNYRPEVWIEKDALVGVIEGVCRELDVTYFSCRGYTSQSEMWAAAQRLIRVERDHDQIPVILHLGDHDPSGIDMSRDIQDRLALFGAEVQFKRLALNIDQVKQYDPPPNPAKLTDSRVNGYLAEHGDESWELDALEPQVLANLIRENVLSYRDEAVFAPVRGREDIDKKLLSAASERWGDVARFLDREAAS